MKDTWEKIKLTCRDNREAFLLMLAALVLFVIVCGPEIMEESFPQADHSAGKTDLSEETEWFGETELYEQFETETETELVQDEISEEELLRQLKFRYGESFFIPMAIPQPDGEELLLPGGEFLIPGYTFRNQSSDPAQRDYSFEGLEDEVQERLEGYDGDWSVYVKNLTSGESFTVNDRPMKSASVMKLFIMGTVYKAFDNEELERTDEIMNLVDKMITASDNESSNQLLSILGSGSYERGINKVDEFIQEYGFSEMTIEYNGFNNSATITDSENFNQVAAKDCGKLLEDIYRRTWVNRAASNEMESLLLAQNTRYKIPAGLPEDVLCGNKTGEMDTTENDAAIIYAQECDYILVVLSSDWNSKDQAVNRIREISSLVYEYLNS